MPLTNLTGIFAGGLSRPTSHPFFSTWIKPRALFFFFFSLALNSAEWIPIPAPVNASGKGGGITFFAANVNKTLVSSALPSPLNLTGGVNPVMVNPVRVSHNLPSHMSYTNLLGKHHRTSPLSSDPTPRPPPPPTPPPPQTPPPLQTPPLPSASPERRRRSSSRSRPPCWLDRRLFCFEYIEKKYGRAYKERLFFFL